MSVPPGTGAGDGGRTAGIICQEDSWTKGAVRGVTACCCGVWALWGAPQGFGSCPCLLFIQGELNGTHRAAARLPAPGLGLCFVDSQASRERGVLWVFRNLWSFPGVTQMKTCFGGLLGLGEWEPRELPLHNLEPTTLAKAYVGAWTSIGGGSAVASGFPRRLWYEHCSSRSASGPLFFLPRGCPSNNCPPMQSLSCKPSPQILL